jgi:mono/diheme cytochrome c family protein
MTKLAFAILGTAVMGLGLGLSADATSPRGQATAKAPAMAASHVAGSMPIDAQNTFVAANCSVCHDDEGKTGGLTLEHFDAAKLEQNAEVAEKMIRKLRAGMMPPPTVKDRPDTATLNAFAAALETRIDQAAALHPNPGRRAFQRLNRAEYGRAIHDLLDIDVDVNAFLPPDTVSHGFDNIADVQGFSPTLMQGYLSAANKIASVALGDRTASPTEATYKVPRTQSQMDHIEGTPWGTRGGVSVLHTFPADGEYTFRIMLHSVPTGQLYGSTVRDEKIEISVNGERVALLPINYRMSEQDPNGMNLVTPRIHVQAGPQRVSAAFLQRFESPVDDLLAPQDYTLADTQIGDGYGVTTLPHLRDFSITGPFKVTGVSDTPSRRKIFACRPTQASDETPCAMMILKRLTSQAYRQPASAGDVEPLMKFYSQARKEGGDFESGIRFALQAILASPRFLFRLEEAPATLRAGQNYRIGDIDLASRLSFFLWDTGPDAELLKVATTGGLRLPAVLEKQVRRMLVDPRSEALSTRFAAQWLRLQDVDNIKPDALLYPSYDYRLAQSFKRETELLFDSLVREDRNVLDLLNADYTFVNERLARHYGIPNITGDAFRRVALGREFDYRRGLLGQGSWLMATSVADRTSPVQRGKWIMEVLLGSPPPPPPPNVPLLDDTKAVAAGGKTLSTRERMEEHRKNPACTSCHRVIDPLGLALENFDVTAAWRIKDNGVAVDPNGDLYDGTKMSGPAGLRRALLSHSESLIRNFTENLMQYALGRRIEYFDQPTVRATVKKAAANDNRFSSFVLGVVNSGAFQMSQAEPVRTTENIQSADRPVKGSRR